MNFVPTGQKFMTRTDSKLTRKKTTEWTHSEQTRKIKQIMLWWEKKQRQKTLSCYEEKKTQMKSYLKLYEMDFYVSLTLCFSSHSTVFFCEFFFCRFVCFSILWLRLFCACIVFFFALIWLRFGYLLTFNCYFIERNIKQKKENKFIRSFW